MCLVHGSLTSNIMRPVRYYTECMYAIQEADAYLYVSANRDPSARVP